MGSAALEGFGSGGGVGGVLTVTAPAGVTVEVSKDGKKKSKTSNAEGIAVFKGLATGTWTLTIRNGTQTSSKPVEITADYSAVIAFFAASISVTFPAGSTCTCSDGATTLTAPNTSGSYTFVVPNAGTWTITATATDGSGKTNSTTVKITTSGESKTATLAYRLYLFQSGTGIAKGYTVTRTRSDGDSYTVSTNGIGASNSNTGAIFYFKPMVDLSKYSSLKCEITVTSLYNGNSQYSVKVGVGTNTTGTKDENPTSDAARMTVGVTSKTTKSVSLSTVNNSNYVKVHGGAAAFTIHNLWLE
jgi:hypothetical protein